MSKAEIDRILEVAANISAFQFRSGTIAGSGRDEMRGEEAGLILPASPSVPELSVAPEQWDNESPPDAAPNPAHSLAKTDTAAERNPRKNVTVLPKSGPRAQLGNAVRSGFGKTNATAKHERTARNKTEPTRSGAAKSARPAATKKGWLASVRLPAPLPKRWRDRSEAAAPPEVPPQRLDLKPFTERNQSFQAQSTQAARAEADESKVVSAPLPAPLPMRRRDRSEPATLPEIPPPSPVTYFPAMPTQRHKWGHGILISLGLCVALPTLVLAGYYYLVAANQYVAEFRFSVSQGNAVLPGAGAPAGTSQTQGGGLSGLASALGGTSGSGMPQNFIVADYFSSRQAVDDLQERINLRDMYTRPSIDWFERFNAKRPNEDFVKYFQRFIYSNYDQVTGLAIGTVRAFSADDAYLIAKTLSSLSEKLINDINERSYKDAIRYAEEETKRADQTLADINARLLTYRATEGTINPLANGVAINITLAQTLQSTLVNLLTQYNAQLALNLDPNAPMARSYKAQINSAREQLEQVENQIANDTPASKALAPVVGRYQELAFEQQTWQSIVVQTKQALEVARANASAQHLYIVPYVTPAKPDSSIVPDRPLNIFFGALIFFGLWLAAAMIYRSIRDHH